MKKNAERIALELLTLPTAPFNESAVVGWIERFVAARLELKLRRDRFGNFLVRRPGRRSARPLLFVAHMDHPGMTALEMLPGSLLRARWDGNVPGRLFVNGTRARFFSDGKWVRGEIVATSEIIDGRAPAQVTFKMRGPVAPGAVGMWDFPDPVVSGNRLTARGCDDVAGVAGLLAFLDESLRSGAGREFQVLFTRAEEAGFVGAIGACEGKFLPRNAVAISIETSKALANARQGDGPIVRVGDRMTAFTPAVTDFLSATAAGLAKQDPGFKFQRRLMDGGTCEATVFTAYGYEAGGLCLPLGNYHNIASKGNRLGAEFIDLRDYHALIRLYGAIVERFGEYGEGSGKFKAWCRSQLARRKRDI